MTVDGEGVTCLHEELRCAAIEGKVEEVKRLISKGGDVIIRNARLTLTFVMGDRDDIHTLMRTSAIEGDKDKVEKLLGEGAMINSHNHHKNTALHFAVFYGHVRVAEVLLKNGAKLDVTNANGQTPLQLAAVKGSLEIVKMLTAAGSPLDAKTAYSGMTALHFASKEGHAEICQHLLDVGAEEEALDEIDQIAEFYAANYPTELVFKKWRKAHGKEETKTSIGSRSQTSASRDTDPTQSKRGSEPTKSPPRDAIATKNAGARVTDSPAKMNSRASPNNDARPSSSQSQRSWGPSQNPSTGAVAAPTPKIPNTRDSSANSLFNSRASPHDPDRQISNLSQSRNETVGSGLSQGAKNGQDPNRLSKQNAGLSGDERVTSERLGSGNEASNDGPNANGGNNRRNTADNSEAFAIATDGNGNSTSDANGSSPGMNVNDPSAGQHSATSSESVTPNPNDSKTKDDSALTDRQGNSNHSEAVNKGYYSDGEEFKKAKQNERKGGNTGTAGNETERAKFKYTKQERDKKTIPTYKRQEFDKDKKKFDYNRGAGNWERVRDHTFEWSDEYKARQKLGVFDRLLGGKKTK